MQEEVKSLQQQLHQRTLEFKELKLEVMKRERDIRLGCADQVPARPRPSLPPSLHPCPAMLKLKLTGLPDAG